MLLLDLDAVNESGLEILNKIRKIQPEIKTLVLSMHSEPLKIQQACNENIFELYSTLSRKEQEVFSLFARGMNTKEAAANLDKGVKTVDNQHTSIYQKLNIHDTIHVALKILQKRWEFKKNLNGKFSLKAH